MVSLYTSRVVLATLGVEDFGIYNVVGGVVTMFAIISTSLSSAISRFITIELGKGDLRRLKTVFSTAVVIQFLMALVVVILAELIGVWFLEYTRSSYECGKLGASVLNFYLWSQFDLYSL